MSDFFKDRYGADELTLTLGIVGIIIALIGTVADVRAVSWIAIAVILVGIVRALSKNTAARRKENEAFCGFAAKVPGLGKLVAGMGGNAGASYTRTPTPGKSKEDRARTARTAKRMWKERKTTAFLKCPTCGQLLSVPKGKGRLRVTCPKCRTKMETRS